MPEVRGFRYRRLVIATKVTSQVGVPGFLLQSIGERTLECRLPSVFYHVFLESKSLRNATNKVASFYCARSTVWELPGLFRKHSMAQKRANLATSYALSHKQVLGQTCYNSTGPHSVTTSKMTTLAVSGGLPQQVLLVEKGSKCTMP